MRIILAFRAFFAALFSAQSATGIRAALEAKPTPAADKPKAEKKAEKKPEPPRRSDAVALLALLQREARFVDIVQEPLADYSDAQIGAAARDVLRDCKTTLDRVFALEPVADAQEGESFQTPDEFDPAVYKLAGNVQGEPPFKGQLTHRGWRAAKCELPQWSGGNEAASVIAAVELQL